MWPEVLENLQSNVDLALATAETEDSEANASATERMLCPCRVLPFNWKDSDAFMSGEGGCDGKFEIILGADCVTLGFSGRLLAKSIAACLSDNGIFYGVSPVERYCKPSFLIQYFTKVLCFFMKQDRISSFHTFCARRRPRF
jgi:hypothetical protein